MNAPSAWLAGSIVALACAVAAGATGGYRYWHNVSELQAELDLIDCSHPSDPEMVERLCYAAPVGTTSGTGVTSLMLAASIHKPELAQYLLRRGAEVNAVDREGRTALMMAGHSTEISKLLIEHGADVGSTCPRWGSALHNSGSAELVTLLIDRGADVNATDREGMTPLMLMANGEQVEQVRTLLERGADVNAADAVGRTALTIAEARRVRVRKPRPGLNATIALLRRYGGSTQPRR